VVLATAAGQRRRVGGHDGEATGRKGMVKIGGPVFATPTTLLALGPRIPQQVEIAALHQLQAGAR
jgi:hypothetical protein